MDTQEQTTRDQTKQPPVQSFRFGAVEVAIWKYESKNGASWSIIPSRHYRDQAGNWQSTRGLTQRDLGDLVVAATTAAQWINEQQALERAASR